MIKNIIQSLYYSRRIKIKSKELDFLQAIESFPDISQTPVGKGKLKIAFIIPGMVRFSGGRTSILRIGTCLVDQGHDVYYITYDNSSMRRMRRNALRNLPYFKGKICQRSALGDCYDVGVATNWISVYHLIANKNSFLAKAYFVQDYEPAFYPEGDLYHLARNTYSFTLKMISLGKWSALRIKKEFPDATVDVVDFPVELKQYELARRKIEIGQVLKLAVYIKPMSKRGVDLLFQCLMLLKKMLVARNMGCEISVFGLDRFITVPIGRNMGRLTHKQLVELYKNSHLGINASFTNISLVPYEMIASGLPVIEWRDGSAPTFFGDDSMIFSGIMPYDFVEKVMRLVDDQTELNRYLERAQKSIAHHTWEKTTKRFEEIIRV